MLSTSNIHAIEGKFKRSSIKLIKTFLFKTNPINISFLLDDNEYCIIYYIGSNNYKWFLTNKRLVLPSLNKDIDLSLIEKVDFINIKTNPDQKSINRELDLFTTDSKFTIILEEKSWPLIYNIFKFIINKN